MKNIPSLRKATILSLLVMVELMLIGLGCYAAPINLASPSLGDKSENNNLMGYLTKYFFTPKDDDIVDNDIEVPIGNNTTAIVPETHNNVTVSGQKISGDSPGKLKETVEKKKVEKRQSLDKKEKSIDLYAKFVGRVKKVLKKTIKFHRNKDEKPIKLLWDSLKPVRNTIFPFLRETTLEDGIREKQKMIIFQLLKEKKQRELMKKLKPETPLPEIKPEPVPPQVIMDYTAKMEKKSALNDMQNDILLKPIGFGAANIPNPKFKYKRPPNFLNYPEFYYYPDQAPPSNSPAYYDEPPQSNLMFYDEDASDQVDSDSRPSQKPVQSETYRSKDEEIKTSIYY